MSIGGTQEVQPLLRCDPGKVPNGEKVGSRTWSGRIALQVNPKRDHVDFAVGYPKIVRHELGVIGAYCYESVDVLQAGADQL